MHFTKMSGSGNDFIVIDNRLGIVSELEASDLAKRLSRHRLSVGADGLVLLSSPGASETEVDYIWRYVNADGSDGEMCGNGAMCAARFAVINGIAAPKHTFLTPSGPVSATVDVDSGQVTLDMVSPGPISGPVTINICGRSLSIWQIPVGVPHSVVFTENADSFADTATFHEIGRAVRNSETVGPAGTNFNVVSRIAQGNWRMRTYERGVEAETLACGTGAVASAIVVGKVTGEGPPIRIRTTGGRDLVVTYQQNDGTFSDVKLTGHAAIVYTAELGPDATIDQDSSQNTRRNSAES